VKYDKILVTGGAGFIGTALLKRLSSQFPDSTLYSLDNYSTGTAKNHISGVTYIGDLTENINNYSWIVPDIVFHFGEYSRVSTSFSDHKRVFDSNIIGTKMVLDFCSENQIRMIYSASSTKFGDQGKNVNKSPYAYYKSVNTETINNYRSWFDFDCSLTYFYNVYGPGQIEEGKYSTVIGVFENQRRNNKPITVCSPGTQVRDFTHIDDIIDGLIVIMEKGKSREYFLGTGEKYSIIEIAKMFSKSIEIIDPRPGERFDSSINLKSMLELGWKAKINIKDYIRGLL